MAKGHESDGAVTLVEETSRGDDGLICGSVNDGMVASGDCVGVHYPHPIVEMDEVILAHVLLVRLKKATLLLEESLSWFLGVYIGLDGVDEDF